MVNCGQFIYAIKAESDFQFYIFLESHQRWKRDKISISSFFVRFSSPEL